MYFRMPDFVFIQSCKGFIVSIIQSPFEQQPAASSGNTIICFYERELSLNEFILMFSWTVLLVVNLD